MSSPSLLYKVYLDPWDGLIQDLHWPLKPLLHQLLGIHAHQAQTSRKDLAPQTITRCRFFVHRLTLFSHRASLVAEPSSSHMALPSPRTKEGLAEVELLLLEFVIICSLASSYFGSSTPKDELKILIVFYQFVKKMQPLRSLLHLLECCLRSIHVHVLPLHIAMRHQWQGKDTTWCI